MTCPELRRFFACVPVDLQRRTDGRLYVSKEGGSMRLFTSRVGQRLLVFTLSWLTAAGAMAQEFRGAVTGLVTDAPAATVGI
jgi:hypothetical protein